VAALVDAIETAAASTDAEAMAKFLSDHGISTGAVRITANRLATELIQPVAQIIDAAKARQGAQMCMA
jgi:hypothetical protein